MTTANLEILACEESAIGMICLRRRELLSSPGTIITEITLDHTLLMSSHHTDSERALSTLALERHGGRDLRVLIGGLGLGYTADAVLSSSRVASVQVAELLPPVIGWVRDGLVPKSGTLNGDARLRVVEADVYALLADAVERPFDLILIDVDHSPDEPLAASSAAFYTEAGLRRAARHLAPGGLLAVWSCADSSPFVAALRTVFDRVEVERVTFENQVLEQTETNWLFLAGNLNGSPPAHPWSGAAAPGSRSAP